MEGIIENGAVISEYPPGTKGRVEFFPKRNRLISSWSKKVLVVEAAESSGALITADFAKKQGREILAPPHEIFSNTGKGSNNLILEGAKVYLNPSQLFIVDECNKTVDKPIVQSVIPVVKKHEEFEQNEEINLPLIEEKILSCINDTAKTIEEIGRDI